MPHYQINTDQAPQAIGIYSQAIKVRSTVYLSGQIPINPQTMQLVSNNFSEQLHQVLNNLSAVANAAGGSLAHIVKLTIYLTDLTNFSIVNDIMAEYFMPPYPARATVGVAALPRGALVEIDAILELG